MNESTTADVLIVGGSIAGLAAAITAKERDPSLNVTVVEKYTSGYAGKANRGAGVMVVLEDSAPEAFAQFYLKHIGRYLNNQKALLKYASMLNSNAEVLDKWSGRVVKDENGKFRTSKWISGPVTRNDDGTLRFTETVDYPWALASIDLDYVLKVYGYARRKGVKFVNRVGMVDLLTDDGRVAGIVGYDIDDGSRRVLTAKSVVLACGNQDWRVSPMWSPARGEGVAAAFRIGARFVNCEFGSFYNWISLENFESEMGAEYALYNDRGENISLQTIKDVHSDINAESLAEWYKQTVAGNGPMHHRLRENPLMANLESMMDAEAMRARPFAARFWNTLMFNAFSHKTNDQVVPGLVGEFGGLWVDEDMATTVPGLFAAGDICVQGSRAWGAVAQPGRHRGSGIAFATYSGRVAGPSAAAFASGAQRPAGHDEQIAAADARFSAPLNSDGSLKPLELVAEIQKVMQPVGNSLYRHERRIRSALARVEELKARLPQLRAADPHHAFGANECASMLLCSEMFFKASLERRESLGWFLREDYPAPSPEGPQWVIVENKDGQVSVHKERVPLEDYPYQP
jgi:succinate dehydrogenase/fumarate reductase flavoprotein subunit